MYSGSGYDVLFGAIHWILLVALFIITFVPIDEFSYNLRPKRAIIWKIKSVCMPILIGVNGLVLIGLNEDIITGLGGLVFECITLICLGIFFAYIFFILDNKRGQDIIRV